MRNTVIIFFVIILTSSALAEVPGMINYQGKLTDDLGDPVTSTVSMTFTIYDAEVDGNSKWTETHPDVDVSNGLFNVMLGTFNPVIDTVFNDTVRYLGITVGGDPELIPRTRLVSVGYSYRVSTVDGATGGIISGDVSIQSDMSVSGNVTVGWNNTNSTNYSIVAGSNNIADASGASVLGGEHNRARADFSVVCGGGGEDTEDSNSAGGYTSCVSGGKRNSASGSGSSVGGGNSNIAGGDYTVVAGGSNNTADSGYAFIGGGDDNEATGNYAVVAGGYRNKARGAYSVVGGGGGGLSADSNIASGASSCVSGGYDNIASQSGSTVGGGGHNEANGDYSTIPGGFDNIASGRNSFAAGYHCNAYSDNSFALGKEASANHDGSFIWGDDDGIYASSDRINQFKVAADGGVYLKINNSTQFDFRYRTDISPWRVLSVSNGAFLSTTGIWTNASDRNLKENFTAVNRKELLDKISALPITRWNYKSEDESSIHIGPVAQDFYAAFGMGGDKGIAAMDEAGIALAAIQELHRKNTELEAEVEELKSLVKELLKDSGRKP